MLNNCDIKDTIASYQWFDRTENVKIHHRQEKEKGDKKVDSDTYVSVSSTKKSIWSGLQISLHGKKQVTKDGSYLR